MVGPPAVSGQQGAPPPGVSGGNEPLPPGQGGVGTSNYNRVPYMPGSDGSSYRQPRTSPAEAARLANAAASAAPLRAHHFDAEAQRRGPSGAR